jgi:tetratricopeptide (TPR) repeat protein
MKINPYVAGNPVGDSPAFIGRMDVLREVRRILRRPQDNAIVLYGQRRIGKTSILQHLAAWLPREGPYCPAYFDLQDKAAWPLGDVLWELARTITYVLGQPAPDLGTDPEIGFHKDWLPIALNDLPDGSSLILLFDEFDVLADPQIEQAGAAFFPYLRHLLASEPQRLQFVFVIGRNVDDLDNIALSLFKGTSALRVSLLNEKDAAELVRLSQKNGTLTWANDAVERVWELAHGHPFLSQQLCSHVWETAYDKQPGEPPIVTPTDVDIAVPGALEASRNTLEWLWGGLGPAERVVASALAEAGPEAITQVELDRRLLESGVRILVGELQDAPRVLQEWDLIEPADGGYRFRVELLRRWIARRKPLARVQEEIDRIEPAAENLFQAAYNLYQGGDLDRAVPLLRQTIGLNPNHLRANELLAGILLAQGEIVEARGLLENLYEYHPAVAKPRLVQTLLLQAQAASEEDERLALYERVLELEPTQPEAIAATIGWVEGLYQEGLRHLENEEWRDAADCFRQIIMRQPDFKDVEQKWVEVKQREALQIEYERGLRYFEQKRWENAAATFRSISEKAPDYRDAEERFVHANQQIKLNALYERASVGIQVERWQEAIRALEQIVEADATYRDATELLDQARLERALESAYFEGVEHFMRENWHTALASFEKVQGLRSEYKDVAEFLRRASKQAELEDLYEKGQEYEAAEQWQQAREVYLQLLTATKGEYRDADKRLANVNDQIRVEADFTRGREALENEQWSDAMRLLEKVLKRKPDHQKSIELLMEARTQRKLKTLYDQAMAHEVVEEWDQAVKVWEQITDVRPDYDGAAERLSRAKQRRRVESLYREGQKYLRDENYGRALERFEQVLDLDPNHQGAIALKKDATGLRKNDIEGRKKGLGWIQWWRSLGGAVQIAFIAVLFALLGTICGVTAGRFIDVLFLNRLLSSPTPETSALQIGAIEILVNNAKIDIAQPQSIVSGGQAKIMVQVEDANGSPIPSDELTCQWNFDPPTQQQEPVPGGECAITYELPDRLPSQLVIVRVTGKDPEKVLGMSTQSVDFVQR